MQYDKDGVVHCWRLTKSQDKSDGAPDTEKDEYNRDEDQLLVSYRSGLVDRRSGQDWTIF